MFDGKLGMTCEAQRTSKLRPKGPLQTKNIPSINRVVYKQFLLEKVIPSIKEKWPVGQKRMTIRIQQDNAKPHIPADDSDVIAACYSDGWNIELVFQPPNSPDFNVLDLGYFASIQSLQYQQPSDNIDDLIKTVESSFRNLHVDTLGNTFLTHQNIMECSMREGGSNSNTLPHVGKAKLRRDNILPTSFECDEDVYTQAIEIAAMRKEDKY
jgi:hypothetical protein